MKLVKSLLNSFFIGLLLFPPINGEVYRIDDLSGGINDTVPGNLIDDNEAVEITNFHVDPFSGGLLQREGSRKQNSVQIGGNKAVDVFAYVQQDNDEFILAKSSTSWYYSSDRGATFTTLITTATDGAIHDCATYIDDKIYCVSQNDGGFSFNGSIHAVVGAMPSAAYIESYQNRLWAAKTAANPGRIFFSGSVQGTTWTKTTDWIDFPESITGIGAPYDGGLPIYTNNSVWMIRGDDPTNFYVQQISGDIGCVNNRTIKNFKINGDEYQIFFSKGANQSENNYYALDGTVIKPIGNKYLNTLATVNIGNKSLRQNEWDLQSEFDAGTYNHVTSTRTLDYIQLFESVIFDDFTDGNITANPAWSNASKWNVGNNPTISYSGGRIKIDSAGLGTNRGFADASPTNLEPYGTWSFDVIPGGTLGNGDTCFFNFITNGNETYRFYLQKGVSADEAGLQSVRATTGTLSSVSGSWMDGSKRFVKIQRRASGNFVVTIDSITAIQTHDSNITTNDGVISVGVLDTDETASCDFDNIRAAAESTGTWTSQDITADASIVSWGTLESDYAASGGSITFKVKVAQNQADLNGVPWITVSLGATQLSTSTNRNLRLRVEFDALNDTVINMPIIDKLTVNWESGTGAIQEPDSDVFSGNYYLTYSGSDETRNQSMLVLNRIGAASEFDYGANGFYGLAVSKGLLFAGDSATDTVNGGYVWELETGNLDNNVSVLAKVTLKHNEFEALADYEKTLQSVYFNYGVGIGTFSAVILENFNEVFNSYTVPFASGTTINRYKIEPYQQTTGKQFGLQFINSYPGARLKLYPPITYHFDKVRLIKQQ